MDDNLAVKSDGTVDLMGMQIKISDIVGSKLVDQFIGTISPEQMEAIQKEIFNEVFEEVERDEYDENTKSFKTITSIQFKKKQKSAYSWQRMEDTTIYARVKSTINERYCDMIENSIQSYLATDEFKSKAESIAKSIIDYALEGYKQDIIDSIRRRLVLPVINPDITDQNIRDIAHDVMAANQRMYSDSQSY